MPLVQELFTPCKPEDYPAEWEVMPDIDTKAAGFRRLSPCSLAVVANELRPAFPLSEIQARKLPSSVAAVRFEQNEVPTMSKTERKDKSTKGTQENTDDEENLVGDSPEEKLHGVPPRDSAVPGAQNPDSVEIKKEVNPNTE